MPADGRRDLTWHFKGLSVKGRGSSNYSLLDYCTMEVHKSSLTFQRMYWKCTLL